MAFMKVLKNKSFFKRYQVKNRRRREAKTDYFARRKMVRQDKDKYNNIKYRLIVRLTSSKIICQIAYATIIGDKIVAQANSKELTAFGVPVGHTNYAAAYCTGLLVARRVLKKFGLDETFKGKEELDGEQYHIEDEIEEGARPFKVILDIGLQRSVVGARLWGALKGAADGGLHIPHNEKNFPGYKAPEEKGAECEYDAEAHKERIFGAHVKEYMEMMQEEDPTKYEAHFAKYIENDIDADGIEDMYTEAHEKIREDPTGEPAEKKDVTFTRKIESDPAECVMAASDGTEHVRSIKLTLAQRREKVQEKIRAHVEAAMAGSDE